MTPGAILNNTDDRHHTAPSNNKTRRHIPALILGKASTWIPLDTPNLFDNENELENIVPTVEELSLAGSPPDPSISRNCCRLVRSSTGTGGDGGIAIFNAPLRATSKLGVLKLGEEKRPHVVFVASGSPGENRKAMFLVPVDIATATVPLDTSCEAKHDCHVEHAALDCPSPPLSPSKRSGAAAGKRHRNEITPPRKHAATITTTGDDDILWHTMLDVDTARKAIIARELQETYAMSGGDVVRLCNQLYSTNSCLQHPIIFDRYQAAIRKAYAFGSYRSAVYDPFLQETAIITLQTIHNDLYHTLYGIFSRTHRTRTAKQDSTSAACQ
jgi:hypothetical protein